MTRRFLVLASMLAAWTPCFAQVPRRNPNLGENYRVEFQGRRFRSDLIAELRLSGAGVSDRRQ